MGPGSAAHQFVARRARETLDAICRTVCAKHRDPIRGKIAVEQHFVRDAVHPDRRPERLLDSRDRRQGQSGGAGAEYHRRDQHMQAVEAGRGEKSRDRCRPAFDQDTAKTALAERAQDRSGREPAVGEW